MLVDNQAISVSHISKEFRSHISSVKALNQITFQLNKGNILGLIGDNGAGKSTLLKIISGLLKPDRGSVSFRGTLSSILDIGSGFHPDLSGLDNIHMAGRLIGLSDKYISSKLDEIIEFSELENFIHTPLKYYSSGMFLRLAFTTSTSFNADILLLDEIMSVGDLHFQQKSKERILQIVNSGSTVILASHNIEALSNICTHGLWLANGETKFFGEINEVVDQYITHNRNISSNMPLILRSVETSTLTIDTKPDEPLVVTEPKSIEPSDSRKTNVNTFKQYANAEKYEGGENEIILLEAGIRGYNKSFEDDLYMDEKMEVMVRYQKPTENPTILSIVVQDKFGHNLMSICDHRLEEKNKVFRNQGKGIFRQSVIIPAGLFNHGIFTISLFYTNEKQEDIAVYKECLFFQIHKSDYSCDIFTYKGNFPGSLLPFFDWNSNQESES